MRPQLTRGNWLAKFKPQNHKRNPLAGLRGGCTQKNGPEDSRGHFYFDLPIGWNS
jgi:hypothetical protein